MLRELMVKTYFKFVVCKISDAYDNTVHPEYHITHSRKVDKRMFKKEEKFKWQTKRCTNWHLWKWWQQVNGGHTDNVNSVDYRWHQWILLHIHTMEIHSDIGWILFFFFPIFFLVVHGHINRCLNDGNNSCRMRHFMRSRKIFWKLNFASSHCFRRNFEIIQYREETKRIK